MMKIPKLVKEKMITENITLEEFAKKYDIEPQYVEYMIDGEVLYTFKMYDIAKRFLGISVNELAEMIGNNGNSNKYTEDEMKEIQELGKIHSNAEDLIEDMKNWK